VDDFEVLFSPGMLQKMEDYALMGFVRRCTPEEQAEPVLHLLRAFSRRGVPVKTVLDAFAEAYRKEEGLTDG
jgi:hypothetical protein